MQIKILILFLLQLTSEADGDVKSINDFKKNYLKILMTKQGFEQIETGLENIEDFTLIHNGFLDEDLYTDLILRSKDRTTLKFLMYNNDKGKFEEKVKEFKAAEGEEILSIK